MATKKKVTPKKKTSSKKKTSVKETAAHKRTPKKTALKKPVLKLVRKIVAPKPAVEKPRPILVDPNDQHGPMHIPSHKPAPAYIRLTQRSWAHKPPLHNIPIPKR